MKPKDFNDSKHRSKILDRIQKLLNVADGTKFEAEADTAMKMAQSYMKQFGLSLTDIELAQELEDEIIKEPLTEHANRKNPEIWERHLSVAVGVVFDCETIRCHGAWNSSKMTYIGFKKDVEMAKIVFTALYISCRSYVVKNYAKESNRFKLSFWEGMALRLRQRAIDEKDEAKKETSGRYALVVVEKSKKVSIWVDENMNVKHSSSSRGRMVDGRGFAKGKEYANTLDLMNREKVNQGQILQLGHAK